MDLLFYKLILMLVFMLLIMMSLIYKYLSNFNEKYKVVSILVINDLFWNIDGLLFVNSFKHAL